jgi:hypothetical protein
MIPFFDRATRSARNSLSHWPGLKIIFACAIACSYLGDPFQIACHSQEAPKPGIPVYLLNPSIIKTRLDKYKGRDKDREKSLDELFKQAGCSQEHLSEQAIPHHKEPNIICILPGETTQQIVVGAHFDHSDEGDGVIDNWSGASLLPSLFQSLSGASRKHTLVFIGFSGEETGEDGSRFYVKQSAKGLSSISLMVCIDSIGMGPTKVWVNRSDKLALNLLANTAKSLKIALSGINIDGEGESDEEPFFERGVKTLVVHSLTDENLPILHSPKDDLKAIKMSDYLDTYKLMVAFLARIDRLPNLENAEGVASDK